MSEKNCNGTSSSSKPSSEEKSSWEFRGQFVPARIFRLLRKGRITATDLLALAMIESQVRPHGEEQGRGCFSSNEYLARGAGVANKYMARRIPYLARLGILLIVKVGGRRYLELEWSRTAEEREVMTGEYGAACRKAHAELRKDLRAKRKKRRESNQKVTPPGNQKVTPPGNQKVTDNIRMKSKKGKVEGGERLPPLTPRNLPDFSGESSDLGNPPANRNGHHVNGKTPGTNGHASNGNGRNGTHDKKAPRETPGKSSAFVSKVRDRDKPHLEDARLLRESLRKQNRQVLGGLQGWPEHLRLLKEADGQDYGDVLKWYCQRCGKDDQAPYGLPSISSAKQFRRCYTWISDCKDRSERKTGRWITEKVLERVETKLGKNRFRVSHVEKEVRRFVEGRWTKGDNGRPRFIPNDETGMSSD